MNLEPLIRGIKWLALEGRLDVETGMPTFDSRQVGRDGVYIAVPGTQVDGHRFIDDAVEKGAKVIVCEELPATRWRDITYLQVAKSSVALGHIAANYYGRPSEKMTVVGITGTNGKTTTATLLSHIFRRLGHKVGLFSTIRNQINEDPVVSTHSTPDAMQINYLMSKMVEAQCEYCFMEVTSHAVAQDRIAGLDFSGGIFTNLTHDHLDYHKTMEAYFQVKKRFFDGLGKNAFALSNVDDDRGEAILRDTQATRHTYGLLSKAEFNWTVRENGPTGLVIEVEDMVLELKLRGRFNAYNALAAYATAILLGANRKELYGILPLLDPVEGRFEVLPKVNGITGIVDFAHTPDGLREILLSVQEIKPNRGRLITVVGCGGDKDKDKRPLMGRIAYNHSDVLILTSDNPRSESPIAIIEDMKQDIEEDVENKLFIFVERREAINQACLMAKPSDFILVAGRGHEQLQSIGHEQIPFYDKTVLQECLKQP